MNEINKRPGVTAKKKVRRLTVRHRIERMRRLRG
jgi:hypothetical protein